jgi:hypothetical protein
LLQADKGRTNKYEQASLNVPPSDRVDESAEMFLTVTFAVYDQAPIACQGDDDIRKVRVVKESFIAGHDAHGDALRLSIAMGAECGSYVQVWDVEVTESPKESEVCDGSLG